MLVCSNTEAKKHQIERHDAYNQSQCHGTVLNPVGRNHVVQKKRNVKQIHKAGTHFKKLSQGILDTYKINFK